jgi:hypothetical protein
LNLPIKEIHIRDKNIHQVLLELSFSYKVPIGLEVSSNDDLLDEKNNISISMTNTKPSSVLDEIIRQKPQYMWEVKDDVINVFPKEALRDPVLQSILSTNIERLTIRKGMSRYNFRESLTGSDSVSKLLKESGVQAENEIFSSEGVAPLGRDFSLDVQNLTVGRILNSVIGKSETKYWIVNRFGDKKEYLLLNL